MTSNSENQTKINSNIVNKILLELEDSGREQHCKGHHTDHRRHYERHKGIDNDELHDIQQNRLIHN